MPLPAPLYNIYIIFNYVFLIASSITVTFTLNAVLSSDTVKMSISVFGLMVGLALLSKSIAEHLMEKDRLEGERGALCALAVWIIYSTVYGLTQVFSTNIWLHLVHDVGLLLIIVFKIRGDDIFPEHTQEKVFRYILFILYVTICAIPFQGTCIGEIPLWDVAVRVVVSLIAHLACEYWKTVVFNNQTSWKEISWMIFAYPLYSTIYSIFGICIVALIFLLEIETIKEKVKWLGFGGFLSRSENQVFTIEDNDHEFDTLNQEKDAEHIISTEDAVQDKQPFSKFELGDDETVPTNSPPPTPVVMHKIPPPVVMPPPVVVVHKPPPTVIIHKAPPSTDTAAPQETLVTLPTKSFSYTQTDTINYGNLETDSWTQLNEEDVETMNLILNQEKKRR